MQQVGQSMSCPTPVFLFIQLSSTRPIIMLNFTFFYQVWIIYVGHIVVGPDIRQQEFQIGKMTQTYLDLHTWQ